MNAPPEERTVFVIWRNTDLNEGRGALVPYAVCEKESTADRLKKGVNVQGANGEVKKATAFKVNGAWYAPARIIGPTEEDDKNEERRERREALVKKILAAGVPPADLKALEQVIRDADQARE